MTEEAKRRWYWPLDRLSIVVAATVFVALCLVNLGAWETRRPEYIPGAFGAYCGLKPEYQHGWPLCYARRDVQRLSDDPRELYKPVSPWQPWQGLLEFRPAALLLDLGAAALLAVLAGGIFQWSRSRRLRWWQWQLVDLFAVTTLVAVVCAVVVVWRLRHREEAKLIDALHQTIPDQRHFGEYVQKDVAEPTFIPDYLADRYRRSFERVVAVQTDRDTHVACQFPRLIMLHAREVPRDFAEHLEQMSDLEVLDLGKAALHRHRATDNFTVVRDLPPHASLRIVDLRETAVENADLAWLARCPRLEVVNLSWTTVGDDGLRHLLELTNLRIVAFASDRLTDEGCRVLSQIDSLEELTIGSSKVTDDGVLQLARLKRLKALVLRTAASAEAMGKLRAQLPDCHIDTGDAVELE